MRWTILIVLVSLAFASDETFSVQEHRSIHNTSTFKPSVKMKEKQQMHRLHKIDEDEAKKIALDETKESVVFLKLTHEGKYLIYKIKTENYRLIVNALDGSVIKKELRK